MHSLSLSAFGVQWPIRSVPSIYLHWREKEVVGGGGGYGHTQFPWLACSVPIQLPRIDALEISSSGRRYRWIPFHCRADFWYIYGCVSTRIHVPVDKSASLPCILANREFEWYIDAPSCYVMHIRCCRRVISPKCLNPAFVHWRWTDYTTVLV